MLALKVAAIPQRGIINSGGTSSPAVVMFDEESQRDDLVYLQTVETLGRPVGTPLRNTTAAGDDVPCY